MFATDSKPPYNEVLKVWYLVTLLKLSGPDGIRVHIKAIKIIMEKILKEVPTKFKIHRTYYTFEKPLQLIWDLAPSNTQVTYVWIPWVCKEST